MTELLAGIGTIQDERYIPAVLIAFILITWIKARGRGGSGSDDDTDTPAKG